MIERILAPKMKTLVQKFPVVTLTGPRQSGKTTLIKTVFDDLPYVSLEEPDIRQFALTDPRGFLANYPQGAVLDEVQQAPELFSYIQSIVDNKPDSLFILSGSANFLLMEKIGQTLAGRSAVLHLLPFSWPELQQGGIAFERYEDLIFTGQYPRIYDYDISPTDFYPSYIQTYLERDVRLLKNIENLNSFVQFVQLCAGRTGQLLNYTSLANDAGISPSTVKAWISVLEASYVVYRLTPYHKNFNKRLIKSPKLYFYDTGLACSLLGIRQADQVTTHFLKGALFENWVLNEFVKRAFNRGERQYPYFWRDNHGLEIDCLLDTPESLIPVEIKSGKTMAQSYFANLKTWQQLTGYQEGYVLYGGDTSMTTSQGKLVSWKQLEQINT